MLLPECVTRTPWAAISAASGANDRTTTALTRGTYLVSVEGSGYVGLGNSTYDAVDTDALVKDEYMLLTVTDDSHYLSVLEATSVLGATAATKLYLVEGHIVI